MSDVHPECGHTVEYMSVELYEPPQVVPMRCLDCFGEWMEAGRCVECGAEPFGFQHAYNMDGSIAESFGFCRTHWMDAIRPDNCARCGRFLGQDMKAVDLGMTEPRWTWDGPEPPEPIVELRCGRCAE